MTEQNEPAKGVAFERESRTKEVIISLYNDEEKAEIYTTNRQVQKFLSQLAKERYSQMREHSQGHYTIPKGWLHIKPGTAEARPLVPREPQIVQGFHPVQGISGWV